jgi:hypothetical protein
LMTGALGNRHFVLSIASRFAVDRLTNRPQ